MNLNTLAKNYSTLTPEERFRLIVSAGARGDDAEQARLIAAGERLSLSVQDHTPFAQAFGEMEKMIFIDLVETAAQYRAALNDVDDAKDLDNPAVGEAEDTIADNSEVEDDARNPAWLRFLDLALVRGYEVKAKADGWKLFCQRLHLPPFALWECLPGFERLQEALRLAERVSFVPEGMLAWLNRIRPDGAPEATDLPLTAESAAHGMESIFRQRVEWWSGT